MDNPIISIIIPVHNSEKYLHKCIESVREQSIKNIEIILVDNLSYDRSSIICDDYAKLDSRIKVLHLTKAGLSYARNEGLKIATAPYVGFIDNDDYIDVDMLELLYHSIQQYKAQISICALYVESKKAIDYQPSNSGKTYYYQTEEALKLLLLGKEISSSVCNKLFKKDLFNNIQFPVDYFYEDHATIFKWFELSDQIIRVDVPKYHYIQREGSICHSSDPVKRYHFFLADYERFIFAEEKGLFKGEEKKIFINLQVSACLSHLKKIMNVTKEKNFRVEIADMRKKLEFFIPYIGKELSPKYSKRLSNILNRWNLYVLFNFSWRVRRECKK